MKAPSNSIGSAWGVLFSCVAAVWVGVLLAGWQLVMRPVQVVDNPRPRSAKLEVIFVQNNEDPTADWQEKLAGMTQGRMSGSLFLTAGDLNTFLRRSIKLPNNPGQPQVYIYTRLNEDRLWMGILMRLKWPKDPLCVQVWGGMARGQDGYYFDPKGMYVGSLPVPRALARPLMGALFEKMFAQPEAEPLRHSWRSIRQLELRERRMDIRWD